MIILNKCENYVQNNKRLSFLNHLCQMSVLCLCIMQQYTSYASNQLNVKQLKHAYNFWSQKHIGNWVVHTTETEWVCVMQMQEMRSKAGYPIVRILHCWFLEQIGFLTLPLMDISTGWDQSALHCSTVTMQQYFQYSSPRSGSVSPSSEPGYARKPYRSIQNSDYSLKRSRHGNFSQHIWCI